MISLNVALIMISATMAAMYGDAFEIRVDRATTTTACIRFRNEPTQEWGYLKPSSVTQQTGEYLCRSFLPGSTTGVIPSYDWDCYVTAAQFNTTLSCPFSGTSDDNCTTTGDGTQKDVRFYAASIQCIVTSTFSASSRLYTARDAIQTLGVHGTSTGRGLVVSSSIAVNYIRPSLHFGQGTICIPSGTSSLNNSVAQAMCRTVGIAGSLNSTMAVGSESAASYPAYLSNLRCDFADGTLWNGGCTYDEAYYDTPTACSEYLPVVICPASFDMRLGDPTEALFGQQIVELRPVGASEFNGIVCISSPYANFATVMCHEMYGDDIDFAGYSSSSITHDSSTKEYVSSVTCSSSSFTSLSQCTASVTPVAYQSPCTYAVGLVTCKINKWNTVFTLSSGLHGKGYLLATVSATGETEGSVCSDGFNQDAALAACRSVGYTPGSQAGFTVASSTTDHAINNVTCLPGADKLSDCKLRYSGSGNKLSYAESGVCSGRVYLDCDVGALDVEFRMTSSRYLQARMNPTSEWGWVDVISGVSGREAYDTMCSKVTSSTGDSTITKSYMSISYCPTSASSFTQCTVVYTNGKKDSRDYYCSTSYSSSSSSSSSSSGDKIGVILPIVFSVGLPVGIIIAIFTYVHIKGRRAAAENDDTRTTTTTNNAMTIEMTTNHLPAPSANNTPVYGQSHNTGFGEPQGGLFRESNPPPSAYPNPPDGIYGQPVMGTAYTGNCSSSYPSDAPSPLGAASTSSSHQPPNPYGCGNYGV